MCGRAEDERNMYRRISSIFVNKLLNWGLIPEIAAIITSGIIQYLYQNVIFMLFLPSSCSRNIIKAEGEKGHGSYEKGLTCWG